jgi:hypothetical protein
MHKLLFALALLLSASFTQAPQVKASPKTPELPVDSGNHLVAYTGVVEVRNTAQAQLYTRVTTWVARYYPAAAAAVQDKVLIVLIG